MENEKDAQPDLDTFVEGIIPGTMSGAEMIDFYKREGVFDTFAYLNDLIGPDKKYANSTDYLHAMREEAARRGREAL